ncbi:MAG: lysylphosphatidylglycerol synthase transmembrane domain-containing protein [bacterium]
MMKAWKWSWTAVRITVCVAMLAYLLYQTDAQSLFRESRAAFSRWPWLVSGVIMTFLGLAAGAIRWRAILYAQGLQFPRLKVLHIFMIGQFFNAFMLGACGGDLARAYYVAKGRQGKRTEAVATILMDRGIGLFSMILFCCLMIPFRLPVFLDNEGPRDTGVLMIIFLAAAMAGIFVLFRKNVFEHFEFFRRLENNTRLGSLIRKAYEAVFVFRQNKRLLVFSLALSLLSMAFLTLACWSFGGALAIRIPLADYFALFPIISVLMAVPITPGSLGVREGLFVSLFRAVSVDQHQAILLSLMVYAGGVFWSIAGGLIYLFLTPAQDRHFTEALDT